MVHLPALISDTNSIDTIQNVQNLLASPSCLVPAIIDKQIERGIYQKSIGQVRANKTSKKDGTGLSVLPAERASVRKVKSLVHQVKDTQSEGGIS